jgi:hypothetical protein
MSLLKSNSVQIGQSTTGTNNFTLSVPSSPDGTIKLARGNSGATTADILTVASNGKVSTTLADSSVAFAQLLSTDWTASLSESGYQKLPSGLIIQWGNGTAVNNTSISFPTTFPTAAYCVIASCSNIGASRIVCAGSISTAGFVASGFITTTGGYSGGETFYYIALGK